MLLKTSGSAKILHNLCHSF